MAARTLPTPSRNICRGRDIVSGTPSLMPRGSVFRRCGSECFSSACMRNLTRKFFSQCRRITRSCPQDTKELEQQPGKLIPAAAELPFRFEHSHRWIDDPDEVDGL